MESNPQLNQYQEERNQLLITIRELLENDPRVKAAWLFGSLGRGDEDALSDIDLWVVVDDAYIEQVIAQPRQFTSQVGHPVLFFDAPQNAPEGGTYLMTCYDAPIAPHIVDWYWQPQSLAYIPDQVRLLFNKAGLERKDQSNNFPGRPADEEIIERPIYFISFFWMMLIITAIQACRSPRAEEMALLPHLVNQMVKARCFLCQEGVLNVPPHAMPGEKIRLLYQLANQMGTLMGRIAEQGEEVPALIIQGVYRYLKLVKSILK